MKNMYTQFFFLMIALLLIIYGQENKTEQLKYSNVKIHITKADDINTVLKSGISLDDSRTEADGIQVILNQLEIKKVAELGYDYTIEIADLQEQAECI